MIVGEVTGTCTQRTAVIGAQASKEGLAGITSGRAIVQQGGDNLRRPTDRGRPEAGKGALGTWRPRLQSGARTQSRGSPSLLSWGEATSKPGADGGMRAPALKPFRRRAGPW